MKKWKCTVCGEIVESDVRPDKCPLCKQPGEKFVELVEEEMTWVGSGVVISEDGYIATNTHVVELSEDEVYDCVLISLLFFKL